MLWGYAVGRAFNRSWSDARCPISTLTLNYVSEAYFQWYSPINLNNIQVGDIVAWGSKGAEHVAYITDIYSRDNNGIILADRQNTGGSERTNLSLSFLIIERGGNPNGYFRKKKNWSIIVENEVEGNHNVGKVGISGGGYGDQYDSPKTADQLDWESNMTIDAVFDGTLYNNYKRKFNQWELDGSSIPASKSYNFQITDYYQYSHTYDAVFKKEFNITLQNNFVSVGNTGIINVSGTQYSLPASSFQVSEGNSITATAIDQTVNGIRYSFTRWSNNSTSATTTFYPTDHTIYSASFTGKPSNENRNLQATAVVGESPILTWTDNVNSNVTQYQIWRYVKEQSTGEITISQIATVNRGIQTYTDYDYVVTSGYVEDLLKYDVRGYYSVENNYADDAFTVAVFARLNFKLPGNKDTLNAPFVDTGFSLSCYPNPFNPETTILYEIPADGMVTLKIYGPNGKEVATLVNQFKIKGIYQITFDGSKLSSGVYLYHLLSNGFSKTGKMLLMK